MVPIIMAVRFICEIVALVIFGLWGFHNGKLIGAIGIPLVVAVIWSLLGSPKAPYQLQGGYRLILEGAIFIGASYCLYSLGYTKLAITYLIVTVVTALLILLLKI